LCDVRTAATKSDRVGESTIKGAAKCRAAKNMPGWEPGKKVLIVIDNARISVAQLQCGRTAEESSQLRVTLWYATQAWFYVFQEQRGVAPRREALHGRD
jgi:hypothetical protein